MRTRRSPRSGNAVLRLGGGAVLAAMALGSQGGCTREFYREWANQDVSEAVFEKSRDPRWRIDLFTVEPPALSRFADPYDQDAPPAPPDDVATEALSPVPQWPSNRLIVPTEGTGYLELLEFWQRKDLALENSAREKARTLGGFAANVAPRRGELVPRGPVESRLHRPAAQPGLRRLPGVDQHRPGVAPGHPVRAVPGHGQPLRTRRDHQAVATRSTPTSRPGPRPCRWCPAPAARWRPGPETSARSPASGPARGAGPDRAVPGCPASGVPRLSPGSPSNALPGPPPSALSRLAQQRHARPWSSGLPRFA